MGAERLLRGEPEHRRAQRGDDAGNRRPGHALAVRADERVVVQRLEVGAHGRDRPRIRVTARIDLARMADAEPEQEPVVERVGEDARRIRRRDGVPSPDVRDAGRDADPLRRAEQDGGVRERLARAEALRVPERVVAEPLHLARGGTRIRRRRHGERAAPDADPPELHAPTIVRLARGPLPLPFPA